MYSPIPGSYHAVSASIGLEIPTDTRPKSPVFSDATAQGRESAAVRFAGTWKSEWPEGRVVRLFTEDDDPLLKQRPRDRTKVYLTQFQLNPSSKSSNWSADGTSIGADVIKLAQRLIPPRRPKKPKSGSKTPTPSKKRVQPNF